MQFETVDTKLLHSKHAKMSVIDLQGRKSSLQKSKPLDSSRKIFNVWIYIVIRSAKKYFIFCANKAPF